MAISDLESQRAAVESQLSQAKLAESDLLRQKADLDRQLNAVKADKLNAAETERKQRVKTAIELARRDFDSAESAHRRADEELLQAILAARSAILPVVEPTDAARQAYSEAKRVFRRRLKETGATEQEIEYAMRDLPAVVTSSKAAAAFKGFLDDTKEYRSLKL